MAPLSFKEGPESQVGAAKLSVLVNSRPWNIETFKEFTLIVMHFRCYFSWEKRSRKTVIGILEEKKETFDDMIREMAKEAEDINENTREEENQLLAMRSRSGFEFLLEDFPDQLNFCQYLPSLNQWDFSVESLSVLQYEHDYDEFTFEESAIICFNFLDDERESTAMYHWKENHFWWKSSTEYYKSISPQHQLQDFMVNTEKYIMEGKDGEGLMKLFYHEFSSITLYDTITPRRRRFVEKHLENLKTYWKEYILFQYSHISNCRLSALEELLKPFPEHLEEFLKLEEYKEFRRREKAYKREKIREHEERTMESNICWMRYEELQDERKSLAGYDY